MGRILNSQSSYILGVADTGIVISDNTTNNVSISAHGFCPKAPNNSGYYLRGDGTWAALSTATVGTATTLATPRAINGVNFDGSAPITIYDATKVKDIGGAYNVIVNYGSAVVTFSGGSGTLTFSSAFPSAPLSISFWNGDGGAVPYGVLAVNGNPSASSQGLKAWQLAAAYGGSFRVNYLAIGY